ncbi:hypothetical protein E4U42_005933, partial [Claviceps africana]
MKTSFAAAAATLVAGLVSANPLPPTSQADGSASAGVGGMSADNDYACRSTQHPNPVVMLHALGGNKNFDLNLLGGWLRLYGFCTFSLTYGAAPGSAIGGLDAINQSAP